MNTLNRKVVVHLGKIFALASVRAKRAKGGIPTGAAKSPRANFIIFVVGFPVVAFLSYSFGDTFLGDIPVATFFINVSMFLPSLMAMAAIMFGLLSELQVTSTGSTNMINWLPIRASEYVLASTLALAYFLMPILAVFFGATFGIALSLHMIDIWLVSLGFGLAGLFLGTFLAEILRALMNRVSASVSKQSGRATVVGRMVLGIIMMVVFMLIFNINVLLTVLQHFVGGVDNTWFIPLLWPTLAIISYQAGDTGQALLYTVLNSGFTLGLLWTSVKLRAKYWVSIPISIQLTPSKPYALKRGLLGRVGFTSTEAALVRKDFRGLTRRKEMLGWIAIPITIGILFMITTYSMWATATTTSGKLVAFAGPVWGIVMLAFYLTLTSIGQEGSAIITLLAAPLSTKELTKAKLATALFPTTGALIVLLVIAQLLIHPRVEIMLVMTVVLFTVVFEAAMIGLAVGSRFPDFIEVPRARFITRQGALLGILFLVGSVGGTLLPLFLYTFAEIRILVTLSLPGITLLTAFMAIPISYLSSRAIKHNLQKLLKNMAPS